MTKAVHLVVVAVLAVAHDQGRGLVVRVETMAAGSPAIAGTKAGGGSVMAEAVVLPQGLDQPHVPVRFLTMA